MKRTLGLIFIFILEIAFGVIYYVKSIWNSLIKSAPFFDVIAGWLRNLIHWVESWFNFNEFNDLPTKAKSVIAIVIINILFIVIYLLVFGILNLIIRNHKKKVIASNRKKVFVLSDEEKAKFEWKLYERSFPTRRVVSLLIPALFTFLCIVIRFDKELCASYDLYNPGYFNSFSDSKAQLGGFGIFLENTFSKYIHYNNRIVESINVTWVEWIEIGVAFLLLCLIWYGIFSIFAKPYSRHLAKRRAKKARNNYIIKMENNEYKALKKARKEAEVSQKNRELYNAQSSELVEQPDSTAAPIISYQSEQSSQATLDTSYEKEYIDDIATGVTDLGLIEEDTSELQDPLEERETHFVGDEEIDILLEEEPVVETIEEEDEYYSEEEEEVEETYNRYQGDFVPVLELDDKIKKYNIDVIEEGESISHYEENEPGIMPYDDQQIITPKPVDIENKETVLTPGTQLDTKPTEPVTEEIKVEETQKEELVSEVNDNIIQEPIEEKKIEVLPFTPSGENKSSTIKKPTRPMDVSTDRSKIVEYIISTSSENKAESNNEIEKTEIKEEVKNENGLKPVHPTNERKKNIKPVDPIKV